MPASDALIPVGKVIGTHGIKGMLKIHSYSGNLESLQNAATITLRSPDGKLQELELKSAAPHAGKFMIGLKGLDDINLVLPFVGYEVCLLRSQLPETDEDEYYWCDLIGLSVETDQGRQLGRIEEIFETGSSDIYVVRGNEGEFLIPAIAEVISKIDLPQGKMVITPLEGLLDL